ncbi:MAG TPA: hypothetical protein VMT20_22190 [Terriglobia bacterium]|nr:hypothetical protein [Terriglobia bacterium]
MGGGKLTLLCCRTSWRQREAYVLENDLIRLVSLTGGGHLAEFCLREPSGVGLNPLWNPPWKTIEPYRYQKKSHARRYGPAVTGRTISGIAGHNLCLDFFGAPSADEVTQGLSIHGEAPTLRWQKARSRVTANQALCELTVRLPIAGLRFSREITVRREEPVAYFRETVGNERRADHFFHWVQHVTLGPPFLSHNDSRIFVSGKHGRTFPHGYEGKALLESSRDFRWPNAPATGGGTVDLSRPFVHSGLGFVATLLLDPRRDVEFVVALNTRHHLLFGYCFRRRDFPWIAIWEENQARTEAPWNGCCQARGLEFGSTPFPVGRHESFANGPLFGAPSFSTIRARGRMTASYVAFLIRVPEAFNAVGNVRLSRDEIQVTGSAGGKRQSLRIPAAGLAQAGLV